MALSKRISGLSREAFARAVAILTTSPKMVQKDTRQKYSPCRRVFKLSREAELRPDWLHGFLPCVCLDQPTNPDHLCEWLQQNMPVAKNATAALDESTTHIPPRIQQIFVLLLYNFN